MKGVIVTKSGLKKEKKIKENSFLNNYIIVPFSRGIIGYIAFLSIIVLAKFLGYLIGSQNSFKLDREDILLPVLGFSLLFIFKLAEKAKIRN